MYLYTDTYKFDCENSSVSSHQVALSIIHAGNNVTNLFEGICFTVYEYIRSSTTLHYRIRRYILLIN